MTGLLITAILFPIAGCVVSRMVISSLPSIIDIHLHEELAHLLDVHPAVAVGVTVSPPRIEELDSVLEGVDIDDGVRRPGRAALLLRPKAQDAALRWRKSCFER